MGGSVAQLWCGGCGCGRRWMAVMDACVCESLSLSLFLCLSVCLSLTHSLLCLLPRPALPLSSRHAYTHTLQPLIFMAILDCLEDEGGWKLRASESTAHDTVKITYKFILTRNV